MDRLACVDLPAFPLQLVRKRHPDWAGHPVVVVARDEPHAEVTWVDEAARAVGVLPGHRYAHALSLAPNLRADVIDAGVVAAAVDEVCGRLRAYSPEVEACADAPGVFWLDATGLERLFRSLQRWAREIYADLRGHGFEAALALGYTRFGTYAVARSNRSGVTVFRDEASEHGAARDVPLARLGVEPRLRDQLRRLGVVTVGELIHLPAGGVLERFGSEALRLHRLAAGEQWDPLRPRAPREPVERHLIFDDPERDTERILHALRGALDALLEQLLRARQVLSRVFLEFVLDHAQVDEGRRGRRRSRGSRRGRAGAGVRYLELTGEGGQRVRIDSLRPAEPTLDAAVLMRLLRLRLESAPPAAGVRELRIRVDAQLATREQLDLFRHRPRRDLSAANEALARLRAELGDDAVRKAIVRDGHLPEAQYGWEPLDKVVLPEPRVLEARPLIRRIRARPRLLPPQDNRFREDGWLLGGLQQGPVTRVIGPYIVSGGWWSGGIHREYHFAETRRGDVLWVYYDRRRRRWFEHGRVE